MIHRQLNRFRCAAALLALVALTGACRTPQPSDDAVGGTDTTPTPVAAVPAASAPAAAGGVVPGLEVLLRDSIHLVRGKRVGFITNQSAVTRSGELGADLLHRTPGVTLTALFGAEHGIRGELEAGAKVGSDVDARTGVPVYSLYDRTQRPTAEELANVDVLVFDIQDIGARPYTFVWTMAMAMEEAAKRNIPFVVLDRPNPITDTFEGPLMHPDVRDVTQVITGYYPTPLRHGMTVGEVARYYNETAKVGADLHVVPAEGWDPDTYFDKTGLPFVRPSPNIRSVDAELKFSGLVLAEGTNVHVGRGTETPFSYFGAPWLDAAQLQAAVAKYDLPGVRLVPEQITPTRDPAVYTRYRDTTFTSLRLEVTDRDAFRPVFTTLALLTEAKRLAPQQFRVTNEGFTQMIGSRWARQAFDRGEDPRVIARRWEEENREWARIQERFRLYPRR